MIDGTSLALGLGIGVVGGIGWGRAYVAETVARLVSEVEIARQTGTLRERTASLLADPKSLFAKAAKKMQPAGAQATEEMIASEAAVDQGAALIMADAKAQGHPVSHADARRMAREMMAEVSLT